MKINMTIDTDNILGAEYSGYGEEISFEDLIINRLMEELSAEIHSSKEWKSKNLIDKLVNNMLKESDSAIKEEFKKSIENKINRTNVNLQLKKIISNITQEEIIKNIIDKVDIEQIIKNEVRNIMEEKFK